MTENKNIIISGGGTGGHLFPAIAIRDQIVKNNPKFNVHFVGSIYGIEKNTLAQKGYKHTLLPCLLYTSPSPRDRQKSRMPSSA